MLCPFNLKSMTINEHLSQTLENHQVPESVYLKKAQNDLSFLPVNSSPPFFHLAGMKTLKHTYDKALAWL